ncbi:MAG: acyl-CoA dehydrogenase family protein [Desulfotomaculaceae bacterium]|nr:acyl-CoA dehydrogenase family protein [Desulfotomaculaceae bacterium]
MDFNLTEEQQLIQKIARDYGKEQLEPLAAEIDRTGRFPAEAIKAMGELDFMGMFFPVEHSGAGADFLSYIIMVEELSRACASTGAILATHCSLAACPIFRWGNEEQKKKYLPEMCLGVKLGGFAPGAVPASGPDKVVASLDGDSYVLNGKKCYVANGGVADVYIVFALTDANAGINGLSAFIIDAGSPGITISKQIEKMGLRGLQTAEIVFENVQIPEGNLLGTKNQGNEIYLSILANNGVAAAAQVVGIAQTALETAVKYAKERVQFGRPIAKLQAIQWMLADMAMNIHLTRLATYRVASLIDEGKPHCQEAAMVRVFAAKAGLEVCTNALQIHGGYGYGKDMILERLLRDVKGTIIFDSSYEYPQKFIAGNLLR